MDSHRRTWNLADYQPRITPVEKEKVKRGKITKRNRDLNGKVGSVNIVNLSDKCKSRFYCQICDVLRHDSSSFLSHMNSKAHTKNIGKEVPTHNTSSLAEVRERLNGSKAKKTQAGRAQKIQPTKRKPEKVEEPETEIDTEIKAAMGFCSFGRKKNS